MIRPTLEDVTQYAKDGYGRIPICRELYADFLTPVMAMRKLRHVSRHCFMLESAESNRRWGRYTFLGFDPKLEITCTAGRVTLRGGTTTVEEVEHPGPILRRILKENRSPKIAGMPPLTGGLVGYFACDYIKYSEPTLNRLKSESCDDAIEQFRDLDLMLFDKVIVFDHLRQKILLIVNMRTDDIATEYHRAIMELNTLATLMIQGEPAKIPSLKLKTPLKPLFSCEEYCEMVDRAKRYIREGDIFQVVLSNRLEAEYEGSLFDLYRVLRTTNPSPYMFCFSSDHMEIAGASPETLIRLEDGKLHTFPIAGTRPRGATEEQDQRLEQELLADEKECAEHNMLVDLGRNDLGKISEIGSVRVEKHMSVERYSHVMHLCSEVSGTLQKTRDASDVVDAILPAGTLSGAPKIRACEIIHELEKSPRGIYGGAIGYLDFTGNLDLCIAIRIAFSQHGRIFIRSGAGIVADSVPQTEYQECLNKAQAVINALETAQNMESEEKGN